MREKRPKVPPWREKQMEQELAIPRMECRSGLLASADLYCLTSLNQDSNYTTCPSNLLGSVGADKGNCLWRIR